MSIGSVDMVEEIVPYFGLDQVDLAPISCGGALDAPQLAAPGAPPPFHLSSSLSRKRSISLGA
jgi:hypothetical protein